MCSTHISLTAPHFFFSFYTPPLPPVSACSPWLGHLWMGKVRRLESAVLGISESTAHTLDHISGSRFIFKGGGGVLLFAAHQLLSGLWLYDGSRCSQTVEKPVRSTLQPGIMNPGSRSLKFVILTALQALCVSLWLCSGVLSTSAEGKTWGGTNLLCISCTTQRCMCKSIECIVFLVVSSCHLEEKAFICFIYLTFELTYMHNCAFCILFYPFMSPLWLLWIHHVLWKPLLIQICNICSKRLQCKQAF